MKKENFPNKLSKIIWKIYLVVFVLVAMYSYYMTRHYLGLINLIDFIVSLPSLMGLYGLAFGEKISKAVYWKIYFWFFLVWYIIINFAVPALQQKTNYVYADLLGTLITIPLYAALYIYSFEYLKSER